MSCIGHPISLSSTSTVVRNSAFGSQLKSKLLAVRCAVREYVETQKVASVAEPLLLNAVRGEKVERPPVWLMRQAGRVISRYVKSILHFVQGQKDLVVEISLQPWKVFKPDRVILFSDILTPLPGMSIPFDIVKGKGPLIHNPIRTAEDVDEVTEFVPEESVPYVGKALTILREEVKDDAAVPGFVGAPFTLASYVVEGGSSKHFLKIKRLALSAKGFTFAVTEIHELYGQLH